MIAFHGKKEIKEKYLTRVREHRSLDEIKKGHYFQDGAPGQRRMCAIGCTIHSDNHRAYEDELGIPLVLARLEDRIFENLPNELAMTWPERFLEAIKVGADLSKVWPKFAIFLMTDKTQCTSLHPQCDIVADAYREELRGNKQNWAAVRTSACFNAVGASASDFAAAASDFAVYAASASDSDSDFAAAAAIYAASASDFAVYAASASAYGFKEEAYIAQSEKLLELLKETK